MEPTSREINHGTDKKRDGSSGGKRYINGKGAEVVNVALMCMGRLRLLRSAAGLGWTGHGTRGTSIREEDNL